MKVLILVILFVGCLQITYGMTMAQLKNTAKTMRSVCQPKSNVSNELIDNIKDGEFIDNKNVKCYINCILKMAQTIKNGKFNYDAAVRQIDLLLPEEMKGPAKITLEECRRVPEKYKDPCDAAFHTAKCMYNSNPENFIFP